MTDRPSDTQQGPGAGRWGLRGTGFPRTWAEVRYRDAAALLAVLFAFWMHVDVKLRGQILADQPEIHKTDFTVFTEAAAAFFDGRDPYQVPSPRRWFYLYPPLFALMVTPLVPFDAIAQVMAWYVASVALLFGCFHEARRLWRLVAGDEGQSRDGWKVAIWATLAALLPTLECLQRGQMGIALLYAMLLGYRLILEGRGRWTPFLGGLVLAWAATVKLIPALPIGFLLFQRWSVAVRPDRRPGEVSRAAWPSLGVLAGGVLFLLAIPAAVLGWEANLRHLHTWAGKVATNADPGKASGFHIDSSTNQSFANASHSLMITLRMPGPDDPRLAAVRRAEDPEQARKAEDDARAEMRRADHATRRAVRACQASLLALLLGVAVRTARGDATSLAAGFGLASLAMLLISPVAWSHYFLLGLPAYLAVPARLLRRGRPGAARLMAGSAAFLAWAHYLAKPWVGPIGLLGLGTAAWFAVGCGILLRDRVPGRRAAPAQGGEDSGRGRRARAPHLGGFARPGAIRVDLAEGPQTPG